MTSLDPTVRDRANGSTSPFDTVGAPGTAIHGGFIVENEKDSRLTGTQKYVTYSNLLANTAIVAAGVRFFLNLVSKAGWKAEPADDSPQAEELALLVEGVMEDMTTPWHRVVRRAAMYRFYGFSVQEWTAKQREDGVVGYQDIEPRAQATIERWDTDETGTVLGMIQVSPQTQQELYLPRGKTIYAVDDALNDSPEGLGLFRHLAKPAAKLERYEILEAWGFERDLRGTPVGRGPLAEMLKLVKAKHLTKADVAELKAPIEQFIQNALKGKDTALFLDSAPYRATGEQQSPSGTPQWSVDLLQGSTNSQPEMAKAIERLNREMARVLGVEQLLLGGDSAGSFALSRDKTQNFGLIVDSTLREIRETMEADFLDPLFELNGWDPALKPSFRVDQVQFRDIEQLTGSLEAMAKAGAPLGPDDPAVNEIRDLLGLSNASELGLDLAIPTIPGEGPGTPPAPDTPSDAVPEPEDEGEEV